MDVAMIILGQIVIDVIGIRMVHVLVVYALLK
jgi:hypothetical protein